MDIVAAASLIVSGVTLWVAARFKRRIVKRNEMLNFNAEKEIFCNRLDAFYKGYDEDKQYNAYYLAKTRLLIDEFRNKYTFLNWRLKRKLNSTYKLIVEKCDMEAEESQDTYRLTLCEELRRIVILVRKEEII